MQPYAVIHNPDTEIPPVGYLGSPLHQNWWGPLKDARWSFSDWIAWLYNQSHKLSAGENEGAKETD